MARSILETPVYELAAYKRFVRAWRERFSAFGRRVFVAMMVLGVLAIDTRRNQTFLLFAIALGLVVAAMIGARIGRARARLVVAMPGRAVVGEPVALTGRVVSEDAHGELLRATFTGGGLRRGLTVEPDEAILTNGANEGFRFVLHPKRRGRYVLGSVSLRALDPLGLVAGALVDETRGENLLLVAPPLFEWTEISGALGRRLQPGGIPLASSTSDSLELVGTREWRAGDRLRNVHWRSFARRGTPIVKEFQEEFFPRVAIVIDTHLPERPSKAERAAFESALSVAGSIAAALARRDHVVELLAAGPELYRVALGRGLGHMDSVLEVLACVEPTSDAPLASVGPAVEAEIAQIGTVIAVLLDWDDTRAAFLERVRMAPAEVHAVIVREDATTAAWPDDGTVERMEPSAVARALAKGRA